MEGKTIAVVIAAIALILVILLVLWKVKDGVFA
jgi:hypothetical protein